MNKPLNTQKLKVQPPSDQPIFVKFRVPILALLVIAGGMRFYTSRDKTTNFGDRVEKSQAERDRMQREQDEKLRAAEERRKRGPAAAGPATPAGGLAAPGAAPVPASPEELKTEAMFVYAIAANGAGLRFQLKSGSTREQLNKVSAGLSDACLVPAGAAATCKAPITLDQEAWGAVTLCMPVESLAPNVVRIKPAKKFALNVDQHALKVAADQTASDVELDDVLWKDAAACAAFAKVPPAPIALTKLYALGRGMP